MTEIAPGVGENGYSVGKLFEVAEALSELKAACNPALNDRRITIGQRQRNSQAKRRAARERTREMKARVAEKARERQRGRGYRWRSRVAYGLLPVFAMPMLDMVPGEWSTVGGPEGAAGRFVAMGWLEKGERLPGNGARLVSGLEVPGRQLYRLTAEGEAAASFLWHCAALTALGWRRPALGQKCALVPMWIRGEDVPYRMKGRGDGRAAYPGDGDDFTWPHFGRWPLEPLSGAGKPESGCEVG